MKNEPGGNASNKNNDIVSDGTNTKVLTNKVDMRHRTNKMDVSDLSLNVAVKKIHKVNK